MAPLVMARRSPLPADTARNGSARPGRRREQESCPLASAASRLDRPGVGLPAALQGAAECEIGRGSLACTGHLAGGNERSLADHAQEDALFLQNCERLLGGDVADTVFLAEGLDARHAAGQRAVLDLTAQQSRQLNVQRRRRVMINEHVITVGNVWLMKVPRGSSRNHMVALGCISLQARISRAAARRRPGLTWRMPS
jgi:hypothetical protein